MFWETDLCLGNCYVFWEIDLCLSLLGHRSSAQGKPQSGNEAPQSMDQTININNWGLAKADQKLLTEMKYKIDYLYEKSVTGK